MTEQPLIKLMLISTFVASLAACGTATPGADSVRGTLRLVQAVALPKVEGRIDHLSIDLLGQRLFVAALENNTLEVIDLAAGRVIRTITGLSEPQGIVFVPEFGRIFVANAGDGSCDVFDGASFALIDRLELSTDADNVRYDSGSRLVYVGHGNGALAVIDASTDEVLADIKLDGHPESFQVDPSSSRIFVNVPSANQIAVLDGRARKVIATWLLADALANYPMAVDTANHRLFVGSRLPARLAVFDSGTGKLVASLDSVGDADDIFYDAAHKLVFVIGGDGLIDLFSQQDADHYALSAQVSSAPGARTALWVPELSRLYVAVPHRGDQRAEIRIYEFQP